MKRPFLGKTKWDPRRVNPAPSTAAPEPSLPSAQAPEEETRPDTPIPGRFRIIPPENHTAVQGAYQEARRAVSEALSDAREALRRELNLSTEQLPQTRQSVEYLRGTHTSFGTTLPAVPESHRLIPTPGQEGTITFEVFERAYDTLRHSDRIVFGFDATDVVDPAYEDTVDPYGSITSPAEAAGEITPPRTGRRLAVDEALEERLMMKKFDIWKMMFLALIAFILNTIADAVESIGKAIERALRIKVGFIRINIGKYLAKPFYSLAKLIRRWADKFWEKAMGLTPEPRVEDPGASGVGDLPEAESGSDGQLEEGEEVEEDLSEEVITDGIDIPPHTSTDPRTPSGSGMIFLMAAQQALQSVENEARKEGRAELRQALQRYENARRGEDLLTTYGQMGQTWGVELPGPSQDTTRTAGVDGEDGTDTTSVSLDPVTPGTTQSEEPTGGNTEDIVRREEGTIQQGGGEAIDC